MSIPYRILNQVSKDLDVESIKNLQLLYKGGDEIKKHAERFIPQEEHETKQAYKNKLKWAYYINYFANVVNTFAGNVFSKPLTITPASDASDQSTIGSDLDQDQSNYYRSFSEDADLKGNSFKSILKDVTTTAMVNKFAYLQIDFPDDINEFPDENELQEYKDASLPPRPYIYEIPTLNIIDWSTDRFGKFTFLVIKDIINDRKNLLADRSMQTIQFTIWKKENKQVICQIYQIQTKINECPKEDDLVPLIKEYNTDFKEIPILKFEIPDEMWIGNLIAPVAATIFRKKTALASAMSRNCSPVLVYKQGPEITDSGDISDAAQNPHRGNQAATQAKSKGAVVVGPQDEFSFAEPQGAAYIPLSDSIKDDVDELYRIVCSMAQSIKSSSIQTSASGLSKQMDNHAQEIMIKTFAEQVKLFSKKVYSLISSTKDESIVWNISGMEDYKLVDKDILLQELQSLQIPSKTWMKHHLNRIATDYEPSLTDSETMSVKDEISKAIDSTDDLSSFVINKNKQPEPTPKQKDS